MKAEYLDQINTNNRRLFHLSIIFIAVFAHSAIAQTYVPPIGIPEPEFGINETHNMYTDSLFDFGNGPEVYKDAGNGPYTHYIDNTDPNATDAANPYGTSELPRKTIPSQMLDLPAASVIEIHGGPYSFGTTPHWSSQGTLQKPVFIRGTDPDNRPMITDAGLQIGGSYLIVENLDIYNNSHVSISEGSPTHVALRNCEVYNAEDKIVTYGAGVNAKGEDIVIWHNHIHHHWRDNNIDCHGVYVSEGAKRVWVLDNDIHHNSGNGLQACHQCNPAPQFVYVGGNTFHDDREIAIGLKAVEDIIISQNIMYGYQQSSTSTPAGIIVGADGTSIRTWILFNEIYDCANAIKVEESDTTWIIGNLIYNIGNYAIGLEKHGVLNIVGNTIYDCGTVIDQFWQENFVLNMYDNIIANMKGGNGGAVLSIESKNVYSASVFENNLFWQNGDSVILNLGQGYNKPDLFHKCKTTEDLNTISFGKNNIIGDPLLKDATNSDFSLEEGSVAIDSGVSSYVYSMYQQKYNVGIKYDFKREVRPQGSNWDIGAFEYPAGTFPYEFMLRINTVGNGTVVPSIGEYVDGDEVSITATPDRGNLFDRWSGDLDGNENPATVIMNTDKNIAANFSAEPNPTEELTVVTVTASITENPNIPENTIDDDLGTRWAGFGNGAWLKYDLGIDQDVSEVGVIWHEGGNYTYSFDIEVSTDAIDWKHVFSGVSGGTTSEESFVFGDTTARYVRMICHANDKNDWNSIAEVNIYGHTTTSYIFEKKNNNIPKDFFLNAYPNPFNPYVVIEYKVNARSKSNINVELKIYDALGSEVQTLVNKRQNGGRYKVTLDASGLATGTYYCLLRAGNDFIQTQKLLLLK